MQVDSRGLACCHVLDDYARCFYSAATRSQVFFVSLHPSHRHGQGVARSHTYSQDLQRRASVIFQAHRCSYVGYNGSLSVLIAARPEAPCLACGLGAG